MTVTAARKERERAAREELIVEHARRLLLRDGFQDLNLDELAGAIEYSKGTIYLHFKTKEDLVLAVITRTLKERTDLLERAARFDGTSREKMRALSVACCQFAATDTHYFSNELMLKSHSFWERASEERRRTHQVQTGRLFHIVNNLVQAAITGGDLPAKTKPQEVTLSLIAITLGSQCTVIQPDLAVLCAVEDPLATLQLQHNCMLDGWGWKPHTREIDFGPIDRRIRKEIFPEATWMKI